MAVKKTCRGKADCENAVQGSDTTMLSNGMAAAKKKQITFQQLYFARNICEAKPVTCF